MTSSQPTNLPARRNSDALKEQIASHLSELHDLLERFEEIPVEVGIEMQHALAHLVISSQSVPADYLTQSYQYRQVLSHLERALLDACKKYALKNFAVSSRRKDFMEHWLQARQKEFMEHSKNRIAPSDGSTPELRNQAFDFYRAHLMPSRPYSASAPYRIASTQENLSGDRWKAYARALEDWLRSDLVYGCLLGKKSIDSLTCLIRSFWKYDTAKLCQLNTQVHLDSLLAAWKLAHDHAWPTSIKNILHSHKDFITSYIPCANNWEPRDLSPENEWIRQAYVQLIQHYGLQPWSALSASSARPGV